MSSRRSHAQIVDSTMCIASFDTPGVTSNQLFSSSGIRELDALLMGATARVTPAHLVSWFLNSNGISEVTGYECTCDYMPN